MQELWLAMESMQEYLEDVEQRHDQQLESLTQQLNKGDQRIMQLEADKLKLTQRIMLLEKFQQNPLKLVDILLDKSLTMGAGSTSMHFDINQGCWWGQEKLADIVGGAKGVAILFDGTWYQNP